MIRRADALTILLQRLATLVAETSDRDLNEVLEGRKVMAFVPAQSTASERKQSERSKGSRVGRQTAGGAKVAVRNPIGELQSTTTREQAFRLLEMWHLNASELRGLARSLDIAVRKDDGVDRLRDKIVEGTIGFKLRSGAIRGAP